jgi:hypothetical protein
VRGEFPGRGRDGAGREEKLHRPPFMTGEDLL